MCSFPLKKSDSLSQQPRPPLASSFIEGYKGTSPKIQKEVKKLFKKADSPVEALAYLGKSTSDSNLPNLNPGDVVTVNFGKAPDFWEDNWYEVLTAVGVAVGIWVVAR